MQDVAVRVGAESWLQPICFALIFKYAARNNERKNKEIWAVSKPGHYQGTKNGSIQLKNLFFYAWGSIKLIHSNLKSISYLNLHMFLQEQSVDKK